MEITRFKSSLLPKNVQVDKKELVEIYKKSNFNDESVVYRAINQLDGKIIYLSEYSCWSFDDASTWIHAFETETLAKSCIDYYNLPIQKAIELNEQNRELFIVIKANGDKKVIPGTSYKGFFVNPLYDGDLLIPYWNAGSLKEAGLDEQAHQLARDQVDIRELIEGEEKKYLPHLLKLGENPYGVKIIREDDFSDNNPFKQIAFIKHNCWETGINWYQLSGKYPEEIFKKLRPFLVYHSEEVEEEGDWKGWCASNMEKIEKICKELNITIIINE